MVRAGEEETERKTPDSVLARKMLRFLKPYSARIYLSLFLILLGTIFATLGPYILSLVVNSAIYSKDTQGLIFLSLVFLGIQLLDWIAGSVRTYVIGSLADTTLKDIRHEVFQKLQTLSLDYYSKRQVGWLFSRVISDVSTVNNLVASGLLTSLSDLLLVTGMTIAMLILSPIMTLVALSMVPVVVFFSLAFAKQARDRFRVSRRKIASVSSEVQQSITGIRVIKAFSQEEQSQRNFERANVQYVEAEMSAAVVMASFRPVAELIEAVDMGLILLVGGYEVVSGALLVGTLLAFVTYASRFFWPVREITFLYNNLQEAMAASERILEVLETQPTITDDPEAIDAPQHIRNVEFANVSFEYQSGLEVLKDITLTIREKEKVAVVGPTGAGKTTLSSLLVRFYDPTRGAISINGTDIRKLKVRTLRRRIVLVPQEPFLFSGTIMDNLRYGRPDASDEEILQATKELKLDSFIGSLENGYETEVLEGGLGLSVGQKQLISIARAFIADPSIVVFDEAMSSIDPNTEQTIIGAMRKLLENRTALIIAHRISTIVDADRILVMDVGKIVEEGSHSDLMALGGLYSKLYTTLLLGEEQAVATPRE